jgi:hypothetical protein
MNLYIATANSDWGCIFYNKQIRAGTLAVAATKAARVAKATGKKRTKELMVKVKFVGRENDASYLGLHDDGPQERTL